VETTGLATRRNQITIALGGELDPGLIRPLTGDDYLGVVMPMRI
jgi:DNA polymerase III sliding clamp (beta) subunit (PCNA family)